MEATGQGQNSQQTAQNGKLFVHDGGVSTEHPHGFFITKADLIQKQTTCQAPCARMGMRMTYVWKNLRILPNVSGTVS